MLTLQTYTLGTLIITMTLAAFIFATAVTRSWKLRSALAKMTQLEQSELAWWVKIDTAQPLCTYYFGPFVSTKEAELAQSGYVEDLEQEEAQGISIQIEWCQPNELTLFA